MTPCLEAIQFFRMFSFYPQRLTDSLAVFIFTLIAFTILSADFCTAWLFQHLTFSVVLIPQQFFIIGGCWTAQRITTFKDHWCLEVFLGSVRRSLAFATPSYFYVVFSFATVTTAFPYWLGWTLTTVLYVAFACSRFDITFFFYKLLTAYWLPESSPSLWLLTLPRC